MVENQKHKAIDETFSQRIDELLYSKTDEKVIASKLLQEILQINDEEILKKFRPEFAKITSDFKRQGDRTIIGYDSEIIVIKKPNEYAHKH